MNRVFVSAMASLACCTAAEIRAVEPEVESLPQDFYCAATEATADTLFRSQFEYSDKRLEYADVGYTIADPLVPTVRANLNNFGEIWGRTSPTQTPVPWPGKVFYAVVKNFERGRFIAAKFHVPADVDINTNGQMFHGDNYAGPSLTTTISPICGDFGPVALYCATENQGSGEVMVKWKIAGGNPSFNYCALTPGQDYFINITMTNPAQPHHDCTGNVCKVNMQNSWND